MWKDKSGEDTNEIDGLIKIVSDLIAVIIQDRYSIDRTDRLGKLR